jgi:hypothetical protein
MVNLLIGIYITNDTYVKAIKDTYLKNTDISYKFFNNIDFENYYEIFEWITKKINPDFLFLCNENTYINTDNLLNFISTLEKDELIYAGGHGDYRCIDTNKFYFHSPNPGIILSNKSIKALSNVKLFNEYNLFCKKNNSDLINISGVALGYHASLFNYKIINTEHIHYCNCDGYPCHRGQVDNLSLISCSNMSPNDILNYYKIQNINSLILSDNKKLVIYPSGGLGNLLFQYFNALNLMIENNYELYFVKNLKYWRGDMNNYRIFKNLNYIEESDIIETEYIRLNEKVSYYEPLDLKQNINYILYGYFQSYKYFIKNIHVIKDLLFENIIDEYNEIKNNLKYKNPTCLVHVRRGDYLMYPDIHPVCSEDYYEKSFDIISEMIPNIKFLIFSDDLQYLNNWKLLKDYNHEIIKEVDSIKTLISMSLCDHFILANSTLSLCSYFLRNNKNSIIIGPKNWFGTKAPIWKIEDILPPECIIIT